MIPRWLVPGLAAIASACLASDVTDLLVEAQRAYIRGDLAPAKEKFELILRLDPHNRTAQSYMRRIVADEAQQNVGKAPPNSTQATLSKLILDKVDFREATLEDVLDFLRKKGTQLGGGKVAINFVQQIDEPMRTAKITLSLQQVPFSEVLRYIGELVGAQFVYEPYAIVMKPKGSPASANAAPPPPAGGVKVQGLNGGL
jgi:hypothetical protein